MKRAMLADVLFFPPYTPKEIIQFYGKKVVEVPLIVRHHTPIAKKLDKNKKHVLFIDSGSGVNKIAMETIANHLHLFKNYQFYLPEKLNILADNITLIPESELLLDYISSMDLVVGRAGFNTISECIACRTPMLLFGETLNPEMRENKFFVKEDGLGSFTSLEKLVENTEKVLNDFFEGEYDIIKRNMITHNYRTDGAKVIAEIIAETICK
jgi:UDP-N-acetylglucosamine:LPS N-acetylglucosamine transferase